MAHFSRHWRSHQKEDLDKSILHFTEAIFLLRVKQVTVLNAVQTLYYLAYALLERSEEFSEEPDDIKYAMDCLWYIRRFPLDSLNVPRTVVTTLLIRSLRSQVRFGVGNQTQDIKVMVVLCNELLSSNKSEDVPTDASIYLSEAVSHINLNNEFPTEMLDEMIDCLRNAVKVCSLAPASYKVMYALAKALKLRFIEAHSKEDYDEATVVLEKILEPGGCPESFRILPSILATTLAHWRSDLFGEPEYSELAISRLRTHSSSPSLDERLRVPFKSSLASLTRRRFEEYGLNESLEEANSYISHLVNDSSSPAAGLAESAQELTWSSDFRETYSATDIQQKIEHLEHLLSITPPGTKRYVECLGHLEQWYESKFRRTDNISDLEEAIRYGRLSLDAAPVGDPWRINPLASLHHILFLAFRKTSKISYLEESITLGYEILQLKSAAHSHFHAIRSLVSPLLTREQLLGRIEDRHEVIRLISSGINDEYVQYPDRFELACSWAVLARSLGHPTTLNAYKTSMSLLQKSFSFAPTVSIQHARLVAIGKDCQTVPLDYASYQIYLGQFEEAVETLEQGRALLWSEMRDLRTPVGQLIGEGSPLAKRFAEINQELETLTI